MKSFLIALAIAFGSTVVAAEQVKTPPVKVTPTAPKKEVKKPEIKKPTKVKKAPAAVQKKAAEANK